MDHDPDKRLENEFKNRNEALRAFYHAETLKMTREETESLTPILNSLKDHAARYAEIGPIAEGGEKRITLVHDHRLDRRIAMARAVRAKVPQDYEQFLREARLTANLAHPNIMPIYNMGIDDKGEPFFSMELVPGDSLRNIIRKLKDGDEECRKSYPLEKLLSIYMKVCDAIAYAHSRGVLHLDIKPDNLRIGHFGQVLVCDWGLARVMNQPDHSVPADEDLLDADTLNDMTLSGTMKGTPGFMAPEQTLSFGEKTPKTDIYALGALLYMILTFELPVRGNSALEVIQNTREGNIVPPRRQRRERRIPPSLVAVTMKALALKPEDRYESVVALQHEITLFLGGYPTVAENAGPVAALSLMVRRHSRSAAWLMFFLVVLATGIGIHMATISRQKAEAVAARERAERNFELYKQQEERSRQLGEDLGEAVMYTVKSRDMVNAASMVQVLDTGLKETLKPEERINLLEQKGTLHFVLQQFNAALGCFNQIPPSKRTDLLKELGEKYAKLKPSDTAILSDRQLADLIRNLKSPNRMICYYLYYHHMQAARAAHVPENYAPLAAAILDKLNDVRHSKPLNLARRPDGYHLDLAHMSYSVYTLNILGVYERNVLKPLQLVALDISDTPIARLSELRGLKLNELRMVGIDMPPAKNLLTQLARTDVKRIVIGKGIYSAAMLNELRRKFEVVEVENAPSGGKKRQEGRNAPAAATQASRADAQSPGSTDP